MHRRPVEAHKRWTLFDEAGGVGYNARKLFLYPNWDIRCTLLEGYVAIKSWVEPRGRRDSDGDSTLTGGRDDRCRYVVTYAKIIPSTLRVFVSPIGCEMVRLPCVIFLEALEA